MSQRTGIPERRMRLRTNNNMSENRTIDDLKSAMRNGMYETASSGNATPIEVREMAEAYKILCEAEQIEGETALQKADIRDYYSWVEFRDKTNL